MIAEGHDLGKDAPALPAPRRVSQASRGLTKPTGEENRHAVGERKGGPQPEQEPSCSEKEE